jgi:heme/copper-type cytochrome/quinol oxidase subunit 2
MNTFQTAFWKVFKSTIEEERSSFFFKNYTNVDYLQPIVGSPAPSLFSNLSKTGISPVTFNLNPQRLFSVTSAPLYRNSKVNNFFTYSFPFSLSFESDMIRYSWFDWYSLRNTISTKAIDTSVFNLHGSKDYNHTFTKAPQLTTLNRLDNFFIKYLLARKLTVPSYTYTPFFAEKFYNLNSVFFFNTTLNSLTNNLFRIDYLSWIVLDSSYDATRPSAVQLTPNYTYNSSSNHSYPESRQASSGSSDLAANLTNVLTKRNYMLSAMDFTSNTLESKSNFISNELWSTLGVYSKVPSLKIYEKLNLLTIPTQERENLSAEGSTKNPYKSLRRGITNMIRIQADKAVAMPTDTRLQILAVSKDIIHSWSIPSAGIKIDCIPGYSSHRVVIFSLSGVYWGQCMEICGRFHHWMPIVVYFMRRDLFCLWCTHFIYKAPQYNLTLQSNELFNAPNSASISTPWLYF